MKMFKGSLWVFLIAVAFTMVACGGGSSATTATTTTTTAPSAQSLTLAGTVSTYAGNASRYTDATGSAARFNQPYGVTSDSANLYVADTYNHTIRKVVIATGAVTTLAGTAGLSGMTDGTGTAALFNKPFGVTTDGTNLYVADSYNHTIRKIVISTGVVTTLAGSAAGFSGSTDATGSAARFYYPQGITIDPAGANLYVADSSNSAIRKIVIATGVVTTLAGSAGVPGSTDATGSTARFSNPQGITIDPAGANLYVADSSNSTIRKVVIATGAVTTLAGSAGVTGSTDGTGSAARFLFPNGITTDGTNLYVADNGNNTIRKIVIATGVVSIIAGGSASASGIGSTDGTGTAARFYYPQGITIDPAGANLYVADTSNFTIRKVVIATGGVTTLAGSALSAGSTDGTGTAALFNWPYGITTDGTNLYVADTKNFTIRKVVIATGVVTTLAGTAGLSGMTDGTGTAARFNSPQSITTDGTNLYVADSSNRTIRKIVIASGAVTTLAGSAGLFGSTDGTGTAARFYFPQGVTTDGTNLYVVDSSNSTIRKIVIATGVVTTLAGSAGLFGSTDGTGTAVRFYWPSGITTDGANLYVADTGNNTIRKIQ